MQKWAETKTGSLRFVHIFACMAVKEIKEIYSTAMFLRILVTERKFAMKSLGKTKQFSSRHARSSCHVMIPKQEIKISFYGRSYTFV